MTVRRRSLGMLAACAALGLAGPATAHAADLFVAPTGTDTPGCTPQPCQTIQAAVVAGRSTAGPDTIHIAAGSYAENVAVDATQDAGDALVGAGSGGGATGTTITGASGAVTVGADGNADAAISHLRIESTGKNYAALSVQGGAQHLTDLAVAVSGGGLSSSGISSGDSPVGPTLDGVNVTMDGATTAAAITAGPPFTMSNGTVSLADGAKGAGLSIGGGPGLVLSHVAFHMGSGDSADAVDDGYGDATLDHVTIDGAWTGLAVDVLGSLTMSDSRISGAPGSTVPALVQVSGNAQADRTATIARTVIASHTASAPALSVIRERLVLDSSELLGGSPALSFANPQPTPSDESAYVVSSLLDAGGFGTASPGVASIDAATGTPATTLDVHLLGSIALEPQTDTSSVGALDSECRSSDAPSQVSRGLVRVDCPAGADGNVATADPASLFTAPGTDYSLLPGASAVDAVPESAIALPPGVTASATDLMGNPRVADGGACAPVRDRGPLELQGHPGTVPDPQITYPGGVAPGQLVTFTGSTANLPSGASQSYAWSFGDGSSASGAIVHHAFAAGTQDVSLTVSAGGSCTAAIDTKVTVRTPKAPTVKKPALSAFKSSGRKLSYRDSVKARTTFTVARVSTGRRHGARCVARTRKNAKARHCTRYTTLGAFTHTDAAGKNTVTVPAKLHGKKLAKGRYRILAVARNRAGKSRTATRAYRVR